MPKVHLNILLPANRNKDGRMRVEVDGRIASEFRVLGRGSRGPGDTSFQSRGNTPIGKYSGTFADTIEWPHKSYGPWGGIRLKALSGDAMLAESIIGRKGLMVHGGSMGGKDYWRGAGSLRATYGCLRISNYDMRLLSRIIEEASHNPIARVCSEPEITVTVLTA